MLRAIAAGRTRNSEIVGQTKLSVAQVRQMTAVLERLQLVQQRRPVTSGQSSKKTSYAIVDGFLNFYFRFVDPYRSLLRTRAGAEQHLRQTVLPALDHFVSKPTFEDICREHLREAERASAVGAWWGAVPTGEARRTEQREIDAVALDGAGRATALGSCKWTSSRVSLDQETLLSRLAPHVPKADPLARHYFYARSGFAPALVRLAAGDPARYRLVGPQDLYA